MQAWVGITTVIAGVLAIPGLVIAKTALDVTEQQQLEQQHQQTIGQDEAERATREAHIRRITTWTEDPAGTDKPPSIAIRNGNTLPASVWIVYESKRSMPRDVQYIKIAPCSQVTLAGGPPTGWPNGTDFGPFVIAENIAGGDLWHLREVGEWASPVVSDFEAWGDWSIMISALDPIDTPEEYLKGTERAPRVVTTRDVQMCG